MELTQLKAFVAVANAGGFTAAADLLDVVPSSVTRAVASLETSLGVRLFHRTTRSVTLSDAGRRFYDRITPALDELDAAVEQIDAVQSVVSGHIRVAASVSLGQFLLAPVLKQFTDEHPNISVELILSDSRADLISDGIDVAIRHGMLADSSLIARRLRSVRYRLVASEDYLTNAPALKHPRDITKHTTLTYPYTAFRSQWRFVRGASEHALEITPRIRISNAAALLSCVKSGAGLSLLADWLVDRDIEAGTLANLLPGWTILGNSGDDDPGLWLVTPGRQFVPARNKAFIEFLTGLFEEQSA